MAGLTDPQPVKTGDNTFRDIRSSAELPQPLDEILSPSKQDPRLVINRNSQLFECKIYLQDWSSTAANPKTRFNFSAAKLINPEIVLELVVEEDILNWYTKGYMVVASNLEGFELNPSGSDAVNPPTHTFRGDCRDLLLFSFIPITDEDTKSNDMPSDPLKDAFPIKQWMLRGEYSIYDVEDVQTEDFSLKAKKLYFRDIRYQLMAEQRMEFSTNKIHPVDPSGRIDNEITTGEALSALLMKCNDSETGFDWGDIMSISKDNWDEGASKLFFTAPANFTVMDSVNYILDRHVSKLGTAPGSAIVPRDTNQFTTDPSAFTGEAETPFDFNGTTYVKSHDPARPGFIILSGPDAGKSLLRIPGMTVTASGATNGSQEGKDLCLFTTDRYTGEFELVPFTKLFELSTEGQQPGKYQIEHFIIPTVTQETEQSENVTPGIWKAPFAEGNDWIRDTKLPNMGWIDHYQFVDMSGLDNVRAITNRPVFSYNFKEHQFYCEYKDHSAVNSKDYFTNNYVKKLFGGAGGPSPLLTVNDMRKNVKNLEPVFSTKKTKESRLNDGRNQILFSAIYLNEHISFTTPGSTNRTIGRFIGIDKQPTETTDNKFDWRLLGQWLVTNVKHILTKDGFVNEIQAVKIHSYKDLKINESIP